MSVTDKGKEAFKPQQSRDARVIVGNGSVFVGGNVGAGAAVGTNAMAAGAMRDVHIQAGDTLADLVAAHQQLLNARPTLSSDGQAILDEITKQVDELQKKLKEPGEEKEVEGIIEKTKATLQKLAEITGDAIKLGPAFELLGKSLDWILTHIPKLRWLFISL